MAERHDEMAVRLFLWQNVQYFGFCVIFHKQDRAAIKFHLFYFLYTAAGKKSYTSFNITELCLFLNYTDRGFVDRNVIGEQLISTIYSKRGKFQPVIQSGVCGNGIA